MAASASNSTEPVTRVAARRPPEMPDRETVSPVGIEFLFGVALLVLAFGIKDSVDLAIKERQLDLSYAKEMQALLRRARHATGGRKSCAGEGAPTFVVGGGRSISAERTALSRTCSSLSSTLAWLTCQQ